MMVTVIYAVFFGLLFLGLGVAWVIISRRSKRLRKEAEDLLAAGDRRGALEKYQQLVESDLGTEQGAEAFNRIIDILRSAGCDVTGLEETYREFAEWANATLKGKPATAGSHIKSWVLPMASTGDSLKRIAEAQKTIQATLPQLWQRVPPLPAGEGARSAASGQR